MSDDEDFSVGEEDDEDEDEEEDDDVRMFFPSLWPLSDICSRTLTAKHLLGNEFRRRALRR